MNEIIVAYPTLNTPAVLVDLNTLEVNINEMSRLASEASLKPYDLYNADEVLFSNSTCSIITIVEIGGE